MKYFLLAVAALLLVGTGTYEVMAQSGKTCTSTCYGPPGQRTCTRSCY